MRKRERECEWQTWPAEEQCHFHSLVAVGFLSDTAKFKTFSDYIPDLPGRFSENWKNDW